MRKVIYAHLHDVFFIPGTGQLGSKLPSNEKTLQDFTMFQDEFGGLRLEWTQAGKSKAAAVPSATIKVMVFAEEKAVAVVTPKGK